MQLKGWNYSAGLKWIYLSKLASSITLLQRGLKEAFPNQNNSEQYFDIVMRDIHWVCHPNEGTLGLNVYQVP